jgi:hypothetical protein
LRGAYPVIGETNSLFPDPMNLENLTALRRTIETAKPRKYQPDCGPQKPLSHGWMLPYLLAADDFTWKRWSHWHDLMQAGKIGGNAIPQIQWCSHGSPAARKMRERSLDCITHDGNWKGWSSWSYFNYLMEWLLYAFGHPGQNEEPQEPSGAEGASNRLYQIFNLETLLAYPYDFFGDILAENQHGRRAGFFPTPMNVVEAIVRMTILDDDARTKTVCDPCVGTGRMILVASNYSYRLYGADIDGTVIKATLVNGYLYAPWLVKPFPFLDGPNLDLNQSGAISDSLARTKPDYYENTTPDPNGRAHEPIKKRTPT